VVCRPARCSSSRWASWEGLSLGFFPRSRPLAVARAKGKLRGKAPKLSPRQHRELRRMHTTGEYSIADLAELFSVSRPSVYRALARTDVPA